jgi:hypothetical protein
MHLALYLKPTGFLAQHMRLILKGFKVSCDGREGTDQDALHTFKHWKGKHRLRPHVRG